ncbi:MULTISPECIES: ATP-binding cassette domain-containing protein [unclassified Enterococcus]|uniref:ABC transporter ATP-binding protein n=1 Tax=unclassified Enterococcus TaxID=2608891 RepID=UPI00155778B0|nr:MULTISPECIES: ATP-binding cassette domain-containing protein [unclassified Enterococcus]MBS7576639.1 ATP-binding cassette domain-containing protein [Enterococcus sp. MMGLQ5-2]MBS7583874.1 ATP-binding cassette domain-containing protein [Enterococcus sp. MMGLQ5-1]NPD11735.1 ATP-binding cassette domain-containing protein [Enterococcus sp. MMGLQ5-1]NPD36476.1 ATP-binding cassette domain-containing protein [Enterococcus sp. MMGLQ5-2]
MTEPIVKLNQVSKKIINGISEEKIILKPTDLKVHSGDFITIIGGNGAGKSTLFNLISGSLTATTGQLFLKNQNITQLSEEKRARYISHVFQDPKMGTAPRMTVLENLQIAAKRGEKRHLSISNSEQIKTQFQKLAVEIGNGLESHLNDPAGDLSGGQRQALSLLMTTIKQPDLLLLDEHTAALDPKTSVSLMQLTDKLVKQFGLTALMITHHMEDALKYGNRLLVMKNGEIIEDLDEQAKSNLTLDQALSYFK